MKQQRFSGTALIIVGPTASGKSWLAEQLAPQIHGQIINADVGQFYVPLTIGTAKPAWRSLPVSSHLFDILHEPTDLTVVEYREAVGNIITDLEGSKQVPIIVGGSLFYSKSLLFPPHSPPDSTTSAHAHDINFEQDTQSLWDFLKTIDPVRAQELHPHDRYRIVRALGIWQQTGMLPSHLKPLFDPLCSTVLVALMPSYRELGEKINQRTHDMIMHGWIDEAESLMGTEWQDFAVKKGLIGYTELFSWIAQGKQQKTLPAVVDVIALRTRQYAKRQLTFLKMFVRQVQEAQQASSKVRSVLVFETVDGQTVSSMREKMTEIASGLL